MSSLRRVIQSPQSQGANESIPWQFDFTPWGTPTSGSSYLLDSAGLDITATNMAGATSINGNIVTTPNVHGLTVAKAYKLECRVAIGAATEEAFLDIVCD